MANEGTPISGNLIWVAMTKLIGPNPKCLAQYAHDSPQPERQSSSMSWSMWNPTGYANRHPLLLFFIDIIMP